ncbi:MAG: hypothetical protein VX498_03820 [Myxococcota bacterium]|nr:hypothetical protein [Myxococcota bacterium]
MPLYRSTVLVLFLLMVGCYPTPQVPRPAEDGADPTAEQGDPRGASTTATDSNYDAGAQNKRQAQLAAVLDRLGRDQPTATRAKRAGVGKWRVAEWQKLQEIVMACCEVGSVPCRACLSEVASARMPPDEIWPLYGTFLNPLRHRATAGVEVLGTHLLDQEDGRTRDRAFRVAVGSGVAVRGTPSETKHRAAVIPRFPKLGQPLRILVEQPSPCTEVQGEVKGPDPSGRLDFKLSPDCPPSASKPLAEGELPKAIRYVFVHRIDAMPMSGLDIWVAGTEVPLLRVEPAAEAPR